MNWVLAAGHVLLTVSFKIDCFCSRESAACLQILAGRPILDRRHVVPEVHGHKVVIQDRAAESRVPFKICLRSHFFHF